MISILKVSFHTFLGSSLFLFFFFLFFFYPFLSYLETKKKKGLFFGLHLPYIINVSFIAFLSSIFLGITPQFLLFLLWPIVFSSYDFYAPFWKNYNFVLMSCKFPGLQFPCVAFNSRNIQIMLTKYPNMSKTARVYFGVL